MEKYDLKNNITLMYVTASSFPQGIKEAFDRLHEKLSTREGRVFFGISNPVNSVIKYKAAVQELFDGEGKKLGLETFVVKKGEYLTETLRKWRQDEALIGTTFRKLLADKRLDKTFPCVEWYLNDQDVMCMVRLDESKR